MGITSAKQLTAALEKAKSVGMVEERFAIGDCEVVLRNLRPDEYEAVIAETKELDDLEYLNKWQEGHVCRSIVEINGVDLRETDFVEVEEPDLKNKGTVRTVKRELHDWLRNNILSTWGREAMFTAYRKFSDVILKAESKAKEGVHFVVLEETPEEKFRRAIGELKELEAEVPSAIARAILEEHGYRVPLDAQALDNFDQTAKASAEGGEGSASAAPADAPPSAPAAPAAPVAATPATAANGGHQAAQIMRQRVPMNRQPVPDIAAPVPPEAAAQPVTTPPPAAPVATYNPPLGRSAAIAAAMSAEIGIDDAEIEQLRAAPPQAVLPPGMAPPPNGPPLQPPAAGPKSVIARQGQQHTDPMGLASILNQKPSGVSNPKFNPRTK